MIYEAVLFWRQQPKQKKQEIAIDKETKQDYKFKIGQSLIDFLPCEYQTAIFPKGLKNLLFEFYSECEKEESLYNVKYFLSKLSNSDNGYSLPRSIHRYDEEGNEFLEYVLNTKDEEKNKIDYMLAVAFELVMCKIPVKRCKECRTKWIVICKKDTYYCKECAEIIEEKRNKMNILLSKIRRYFTDKLSDFNNGKRKWDEKEYANILKYQNELEKEYANIFKYKDELGKEHIKRASLSLSEIDDFHTWLKAKRKEWGVTYKVEENNGNDTKKK